MRTITGSLDVGNTRDVIWIPPRTEAVLALVRHGCRPELLVHTPVRPSLGALTARDALAAAEEGGLLSRCDGGAAPDWSNPASIPGSALAPISVIVCTRDRPATLERCLRSLARLRYPEFEVIVVDNASRGEETRRVVESTPFRYVHEPLPGLSRARNRGIAAAHHPIVAFTDDDVVVDSCWLLGLGAAYADGMAEAVTGLVLPLELETRAQHLFEQYGGMGKGLTARVHERRHMPWRDVVGSFRSGVGANMSFRRALLERLGGFDVSLGVGTPAHGGEDLDIFHRVLVADAQLRYAPAALVWHQHRRDAESLRRQLRDDGRAFGVYLFKIWRHRSVPRRQTARYMVEWLRWSAGRLPLRILGRYRLPLGLILAGMAGACQAPWAAAKTRRHAQRLDRQR